MIAIFILILGLTNLLNPVRSVYQKFTSPIQYGLRISAISMKEATQLFHNLNNIRRENIDLIKENHELQGIIVELKRAEEENVLLRNQLELKNDNLVDKELLLAKVLGNLEDTTGTTFILDKGFKQGIELNDNVIVGNHLIGLITEVTNDRSVVRMITSPDTSITVKDIDSSTNIEGLARGDVGTSIRVTRLLPGEKIDKGDIFITSGKDGVFVPGLSVGIVEVVTSDSADPLKNARLKPMLDFTRLEKVFVILD